MVGDREIPNRSHELSARDLARMKPRGVSMELFMQALSIDDELISGEWEVLKKDIGEGNYNPERFKHYYGAGSVRLRRDQLLWHKDAGNRQMWRKEGYSPERVMVNSQIVLGNSLETGGEPLVVNARRSGVSVVVLEESVMVNRVCKSVWEQAQMVLGMESSVVENPEAVGNLFGEMGSRYVDIEGFSLPKLAIVRNVGEVLGGVHKNEDMWNGFWALWKDVQSGAQTNMNIVVAMTYGELLNTDKDLRVGRWIMHNGKTVLGGVRPSDRWNELKSRAGLRVADRVGEMGTRMIDLQNKNEYWMVGE